QLRRYRFGLGHHRSNEPGHLTVPHELFESPAGQSADRVERDIAEQLDPDLMAEPRGDRTPKSGRDERRSNLPQAFGPGPIRLAEADLVAFRVADHAGLDDVRGEICERSDHAIRLDRGRDDAARIDAFEPQSL